jgi:hypothetical protein
MPLEEGKRTYIATEEDERTIFDPLQLQPDHSDAYQHLLTYIEQKLTSIE